jgi:hypothetical protein
VVSKQTAVGTVFEGNEASIGLAVRQAREHYSYIIKREKVWNFIQQGKTFQDERESGRTTPERGFRVLKSGPVGGDEMKRRRGGVDRPIRAGAEIQVPTLYNIGSPARMFGGARCNYLRRRVRGTVKWRKLYSIKAFVCIYTCFVFAI